MRTSPQTAQKTIKKSIEKVIAAFDKQIALLDAGIKKMIDGNPDWSKKDKIIGKRKPQTVKGTEK